MYKNTELTNRGNAIVSDYYLGEQLVSKVKYTPANDVWVLEYIFMKAKVVKKQEDQYFKILIDDEYYKKAYRTKYCK